MKLYLIAILTLLFGGCGFLEYTMEAFDDPETVQMAEDPEAFQEEYNAQAADVTRYRDLLNQEGLTAETAKELAIGLATATERVGKVGASIAEMKVAIAEKSEKEDVPWYYPAGAALALFFTGGAMPTMTGIPIFGKILPKLAPLLEWLKLRNADERQEYHKKAYPPLRADPS